MDQTTMPMQTPRDLFVHELSEVRSAEQIVATMLEAGIAAAVRADVRQALEHHLGETRQQLQNVERIFQRLGAHPRPVTCHAAEGLLTSLRESLASGPSATVTDALLLGGASKTEYFEVAAYNALIQQARNAGMTEIAQLLYDNLEQENAMRQTVDTMILEQAMEMGGRIDPSASTEASAGA